MAFKSICSMMSPYVYTCAIIAVFVFLVVIYASTFKKKLPPGPYGWPVIGSAFSLSTGRSSKMFSDLRKTYGDVFSIQLGQYLYVVINGYDTIRDVFVKNAYVFSDRPRLYVYSTVNKNMGFTFSNGSLWKKTRMFGLQALRGFGFGNKSLESKIMEEVEVFLQAVRTERGKPLDMKNITHISVANIICSIIFGQRYEIDDKEFQRLLLLIDEIFELIGNTNIGHILPILRFVPGDIFQIKKCIHHYDIITQFLGTIVKQHEDSYDEKTIRDYIDAVIRERKNMEKNQVQDSTFSDLNLTMSLLDIFLAGTETTATAIRWFVLFMLHYKDVQDKLYEEIETVVGSSRRPRLEDQSSMIYLQAVITEVMRIRNIVPLSVPHGAMQDIKYKGFTIPKGAVIIQNLDSVMSDPELFDEPDKFNPSRFIDEDGQLVNHQKVIAFSLGSRVCLGEALARNELFLFLTSLIQRFVLMPENDDELPSLEGIDGMTYSPKPFRVRAIERH